MSLLSRVLRCTHRLETESDTWAVYFFSVSAVADDRSSETPVVFPGPAGAF